MEPTPLPTSTKLLELLLQDCNQKLAAVTDAWLFEQDRLAAIEEFVRGVADENDSAARFAHLIERGRSRIPLRFGVSSITTPYLDKDLLGVIEDTHRSGIAQIELAGVAVTKRENAAADLAAGFTKIVCSLHALVLLLRGMEDRILAAIDGRGDTGQDTGAVIQKIMPRNPAILRCYFDVKIGELVGTSQADVIKEFAANQGMKTAALTRGVDRFKRRLKETGIDL